jgi:hypothetical protein
MKVSKITLALIASILLIFSVSCAPVISGLASGPSERNLESNQQAAISQEDIDQAGTTLIADVTATAFWEIAYEWGIEKSVAPDQWDLFRGDSGTSLYTVAVTKGEQAENAWIEGEVYVINDGDEDTEDLMIEIELFNGQPPPDDLIDSFVLDISEKPILEPGEEHYYAYTATIPSEYIFAGGTYKVTANITITNHSGQIGDPFGPSPSADADLPSEPDETNASITVEDTNGMSWTFDESGSETYPMDFVCDEDQGLHENTATIIFDDDSAGASDSATVQVNCYALGVSKDAETFFSNGWLWNITKTGDQSSVELEIGETAQVGYSVVVTASLGNGDFSVSGNIEIENPAPMAATINSVTDVISPDIEATVDCGGVVFPFELAAGGTLECSYSAELEDAETRTNTATVTLQNYAFDAELNPTATGTTIFTATAEVIFDDPSEANDECIQVSDSLFGDLGTACADESPKTFDYTLMVGPYDTCGSFNFTNTASFVADDSGATGSDSWTIMVNVPCPVGACTYSQGYWKTHSKYGPAPHDDAWDNIGEDTPFFMSGQSWYQVLNTPPMGGNAYYILAHQYIAARLNIENGADGSAVSAALNWAEDFFNQYTPEDDLDKEVRDQALMHKDTLDQYNNGLIGPGKCD